MFSCVIVRPMFSRYVEATVMPALMAVAQTAHVVVPVALMMMANACVAEKDVMGL